jgi:hypothetical protein
MDFARQEDQRMRSTVLAAAMGAAVLAACQQAATRPAAASGGAAPAGPRDSGTVALHRTTLVAKTNAPAATTGGYSHEAATKLFRAAKYSLAEAMCQQAVAAIERGGKQGGGDKNPALADPLNDLATVYLRIGRFDDARKLTERAEKLLNPLDHEQAVVLARVQTNKAWRHYAWGETGLAEKWFTSA